MNRRFVYPSNLQQKCCNHEITYIELVPLFSSNSAPWVGLVDSLPAHFQVFWFSQAIFHFYCKVNPLLLDTWDFGLLQLPSNIGCLGLEISSKFGPLSTHFRIFRKKISFSCVGFSAYSLLFYNNILASQQQLTANHFIVRESVREAGNATARAKNSALDIERKTIEVTVSVE